MANLKVNLAGVAFENPVIAASGAFGFGKEYAEIYSLESFGGIACKGMTIEKRAGNPPSRVTETTGGMLNAVGLQNPGVSAFIDDTLPWLSEQNIRIIANIAGNSYEDYCAVAEKLNGTSVDMVELNISCPNVKQGGVQFGTTARGVSEITRLVKAATEKPLIVKLSPNVTDISEMAVAAEEARADAISMINTITGMRIDIETKRPILHNNTGGLSGPAILPVALRMVWQVASKVKIPIIGIGGISCWQDVVEMFLAGASAVQVGTAIFTDPYVAIKITEGLNRYLDSKSIENVSDLTGKMQIW